LRPFLKQIPALAGLLLACTGCSAADFLNFLVPTSGYTLRRDIAYGELPRQQLDLYLPNHPAKDNPVIVFFYGGSWAGGNRNYYRFLGQSLTAMGYTVAVPDYRVLPEARYPVFLEDNARAVRWVRDHIAEYGGNPQSLYLMGHSAGAYNAVMLGLNETYLKHSVAIRGVIALAGPYDFLPLTDPKVIDVFSTELDLPRTQPIGYARAHAPPMLLLHGTADRTVLPRNSERLAAKLKSLGNDITLKEYPGMAHYGIVLQLATPLNRSSQLRDEIAKFITSH
jgi:acetyl esterase/lipase